MAPRSQRKRPGGVLARIGGTKGRCFSVSGSQRPLPLLLTWDIECWRVGLRVGIACCNPSRPWPELGDTSDGLSPPNVIHFFLPLRRSLACASRIPHVATETVGEVHLNDPILSRSLSLPTLGHHQPASQCQTSFLACKYTHNALSPGSVRSVLHPWSPSAGTRGSNLTLPCSCARSPSRLVTHVGSVPGQGQASSTPS